MKFETVENYKDNPADFNLADTNKNRGLKSGADSVYLIVKEGPSEKPVKRKLRS